jgi:5'-methylthioadenosine phosphorylase
MTASPIIGIIGGSGLYDIDGLADIRWERVDSPFGCTSDEFLFGRLNGQQLVFLPRHGRGHKIPPSELNYRANIDALKRAGATEIISLSACGSFKEELARQKSFFGTGMVAHVGFGHPVCSRLGDVLEEGAKVLGIKTVRGGTYLAMEGPQFSTRAESLLYKNWGCDVIGMTNMPEAKLAREAEMCYATVAMVTDFDCWHPDHEHVTVDAIIKVLLSNANNASSLVKQVIPKLSDRVGNCSDGCHVALENALITSPDDRDPKILAQLDAVAGRVL